MIRLVRHLVSRLRRTDMLEELEALRADHESLRARAASDRVWEDRLMRRIAFLEKGHGVATRLIGEARAERDLMRRMHQDADTRASLAASDRLLATRFNEDLLRQLRASQLDGSQLEGWQLEGSQLHAERGDPENSAEPAVGASPEPASSGGVPGRSLR